MDCFLAFVFGTELFRSVMLRARTTKLELTQKYARVQELKERYVRLVWTLFMLRAMPDGLDEGLVAKTNDAIAQYERVIAAAKRELDEHEFIFLRALFN